MYKFKTFLVALSLIISFDGISQLQQPTAKTGQVSQKTSAEVGQRQGEEKSKYIIHVESSAANESASSEILPFEEQILEHDLNMINQLIDAYQTKYDYMKSRDVERSPEQLKKISAWYKEMEYKLSLLRNRQTELSH